MDDATRHFLSVLGILVCFGLIAALALPDNLCMPRDDED